MIASIRETRSNSKGQFYEALVVFPQRQSTNVGYLHFLDSRTIRPYNLREDMMRIVSAVFRILVGIVFGALASIALAPAFAAFSSSGESNSWIFIPIVILLTALLAFFAPTMRRAFGRGFLIAGVSFLFLPLSVMLLSGRAASEVVGAADAANQGATALGAGIAGVAMTGFATFIGLIVGTVFIIIGLVLALGGRREVIVVNEVAVVNRGSK